MGESTDQIRQEIDRSRQDAAAKIDQLQNQVEGTAEGLRTNVQDTAEGLVTGVQETAESLATGVQETAEQVREQVSGVIEDTIQSVKENVDLKQMIEERPLVALGVALVGGFVLGGVTGNDGGGQHHYQESSQAGYSGARSSGGSSSPMGSGIRTAIQKTGIEDTLSSAVAALVGSMSDQIKDTLDRNLPGFADKMQSAQQTPGSFADKARETQSPDNA